MATNNDFKVKNGLIVQGDIQQQNAQYLRARLTNGTSTRTFGLNGANALYMGSIDTATGGDWIFMNGVERMRINTTGAISVNVGAPINNSQFSTYAPASTNAIVTQVTTNANSLFQGFNASTVLQFQMTGNGDLYSAGTVAIGNQTIQRSAKLFVNAANTSLASTTANVYVNTTNTQAADIGGSMAFGGKNDNAGASDAPFAYIAGRKENGTTGDFAGYFQVGVTQGGAGTIEAMRITSIGNMGLGTTSPTSNGSTFRNVEVRGTTGGGGFFYSGDSSTKFRVGYAGAVGGGTIGTMVAEPLVFETNSTEKGRFTSNGDFGVGATPTNYGAGYKSIGLNGSTGGVYDVFVNGTRQMSMFAIAAESRIDSFGSRPLNFYVNGAQRAQFADGACTFTQQLTCQQNLVVNSTAGQIALFNTTTAAGGYATWQTSGNSIADWGSGQQTFTTGSTNQDFGINARLGSLVLGSAQAERMRILQNGRVLVSRSTDSGLGNFQVSGTVDFSGTNSSSGLGSGEQVLWLRNTSAIANARGGGIRWDMGSYTSGAAQIDMVNTGNANDAYLLFSTRNSGTIAERMRVDGGGITVTGAVTETSTIRVKKNVRPIEGALEAVMGLQGVVYDLKDDSAHEQHGLIAEEVQKVLPNVVYRDEDGEIAGVQYARVVAVLIEAMKEQEARIKALEAIIAKG